MKRTTARPNKRMVARPHNGGEWTSARFHSFIMSQLRRGHWPPKYKAVQRAYVEDGINPKTGRKCKLHCCEICHELFPAKDMQADHVSPVIPIEGFDSWDNVIARLYCEVEHFQAICKTCHKAKTKEENKLRREHKKNLTQRTSKAK